MDLPVGLLERIVDSLAEPQDVAQLRQNDRDERWPISSPEDLKKLCRKVREPVQAAAHLRHCCRAWRRLVDAQPSGLMALSFGSRLLRDVYRAKNDRPLKTSWSGGPNSSQAKLLSYFSPKNELWLTKQTLSAGAFSNLALPGRTLCDALKGLGRAKPQIKALNIGGMALADLSATQIEDPYHPLNEALASLAGLSSLQHLSLDYSYLKGVPVGLAALSKLKGLSLRHVQVAQVPDWFVERLVGLTFLNLTSTDFDAVGEAALQARMPTVRIER